MSGDNVDAGLVVTTPTDTRIVMTRRFAAPRRLVFAALTEPDLLRRWLGADGWHLIEADVDLRVGGRWRFVSRGPGGALLGHGGEYRVVDPPARLVYTERYDDRWVAGEALVEAALTEVDEGRATVLTTTLTYPSRELRDHVLRSPMARGVGEGHRRLD
ncbi:MAG TPA: SRPBCC domain-containing protein, partial [Acidimicrobiales bacterium]